jgi:hypothetical protein
MGRLQDGVAEDMVEVECADAELLLSFTEMNEKGFY